MTDYLYKFPDESIAKTVLADYCDAEHGWKLTGTGFALDPVGVLVDGETTLDGWHLNLRVMDDRPNPAATYAVTPSQQRRVWL
jgi:hypothetical protein